MRIRQGRGKVKTRVALSESDIVDACYEYLKKRGYTLADISYLVVPTKKEELDKLNRKRRKKVEFRVDVESHEETGEIETLVKQKGVNWVLAELLVQVTKAKGDEKDPSYLDKLAENLTKTLKDYEARYEILPE